MSGRSNDTTERIESDLISRRNRLLEFDQLAIEIQHSRIRDGSNTKCTIVLRNSSVVRSTSGNTETHDLLGHHSELHFDDETSHRRLGTESRARFDPSFRSLFVENFRIVTVERETTVGVV